MADKAEQYKKANKDESKVQERTKADGSKEYLDEPSGEWVSKSELKKRQTKRKKEAAAAEKAAKKEAEKKD